MNTYPDKPTHTPGARRAQARRRLLVIAGGSTLGGALSQWVKPSVNSILLPAHAVFSSVSFDVRLELPSGEPVPSDIELGNGAIQHFTANVRGGGGDYVYVWTVDGVIQTIPGQRQHIFAFSRSPTKRTVYALEVSVTDANAVTLTRSAFITVGARS